jgi:hypothetical protein
VNERRPGLTGPKVSFASILRWGTETEDCITSPAARDALASTATLTKLCRLIKLWR